MSDTQDGQQAEEPPARGVAADTPPLPGFEDVVEARQRITGMALVTPAIESPIVNARAGARIFLKAEMLQRTGSFKFRGAHNLISQIPPGGAPGGVVACSSGNHAQGVAEAARLAGLPAAIVMPRDAPELKVARTRRSGAEVILYDRDTQDRDEIARALCAERGAVFVPPYDHPDIMAGQGTVGLELHEQMAAAGAVPAAVLVPCSGGGLSSGVALAIRHLSPESAVYAVEPEGFDDYARSLRSGQRERNDAMSGSICDALLIAQPGKLTFALNRDLLAGGLAVSNAQVREAMRFAFEELKLVVEPGGAVALAALLSGAFKPARDSAVGVVLSGGNVDRQAYCRLIVQQPDPDSGASS